MTHCIVAASDSGYFYLLKDLLLSIKAHVSRPDVVVGVMDLGLKPEERAWVEDHAAHVVDEKDIGWHLDASVIKGLPIHFKAQTARPYLPTYFPGHETLIWIDADAWVQSGDAVDHLITAAANGKMAIVPELDRAYPSAVPRAKVRTAPGGYARKATTYLRQAFNNHYERKLGSETLFQSTYNSGVLAMRPDCVGWDAWAESYRVLKSPGKLQPNDQPAINHAIYTGAVEVHPLPARCNWILDLAHPLWDEERNCFVEPLVPHTPIGILHLLGLSKNKSFDVHTLKGGTVDRGFRFPADLY